MFRNDSSVSSKQIRHLRLRQPHSLTLNAHFQPGDFVWLIYDDLTLILTIVHNYSTLVCKVQNLQKEHHQSTAERRF